MALLEQVTSAPNWMGALEVALLRPAGVPERRSNEDPWHPSPNGRPRRISDDLAWFRDAMDEPDRHGLESLQDTAAEGVWRPAEDPLGRLQRLRERGVLDAAGFLLHD